MIWQSIIALLAGVGVFIAGMNMMGEGLERSAGKGMKKMLGTLTNNRLAGVGVGAGVTAIIQSSSATSVMVIGFVNAGVMTLTQAASILLGANIGTTVTGVIVSLKSLNISLYATFFAFVGVMMTFIKNEKVKNVGSILCGLGIIFIGLDLMSAAFAGEEINQFFRDIFAVVDFPLLLILIGIVFTAIIQSSSAATGVVIIMVGEGALTLESAMFIVLGSNIGTCITALIAGIGTNVNARRTAIMHLSFKVVGMIIFTSILWPLAGTIANVLRNLVPTPQMQVAWFHVCFNVLNTFLLLPFIKYFVKFAEFAVKDKSIEEDERKLRFVDDLLLKTPPIALMQTKKEIEYMTNLAKENVRLASEAIFTGDRKISEKIAENEKIIDFTNKALTKFLIKLTALVNGSDEKIIGSYFHVLNDVERICDHAENFYEIGEQMKEEEIEFSGVAKEEIGSMFDEVLEMFDIATDVFNNSKTEELALLGEKENVVDGYKKRLNTNHVTRLASGACSTELSAYYFSTVSGLERIADHLVNVGYSTINPTGSQNA
ncbi:MAG: Na/Pi cotransporter family protein [Clostridia bacterium]|nr:Na/Pi cotransporter family protein [Clostridia bacterium]